MAWNRGRYYTRSRKVEGRVVREYVGGGIIGTLASQRDEIKRGEREEERAALRAARKETAGIAAAVRAASEAATSAVREALQAAGYHQHKRGEWRKRRGAEASEGVR